MYDGKRFVQMQVIQSSGNVGGYRDNFVVA